MPHLVSPAARRPLWVTLLLLLLASPATSVTAQTEPPPTPKQEVADTYFGTVIPDPFRWMEAPVPRNPEFLDWLRRQNAYTRHILDGLPERPGLEARLAELAEVVTTVAQVRLAGSRWFYLKLKPGEQTPKLYARELRSGRDRMLLDPDTLSGADEGHWAIDYVVPTPDGRLVAYGTSRGGSEKTTLHLMDASTGRLLPDSISRVQFGPGVHWASDGRSFYYNRLSAAGDTNPSLRYRNTAAFRHVVGSRAERDELILAPDSTPAVPLGPNDFPNVVPVEGSPYLFALVIHGVKNEITLYAVRTTELRGTSTPWRRLADVDDAVVAADFHGSDVYLLTHRDAPRFRVLRIRADQRGLGGAKVVVPEGKSVLTAIGVAKDALYVQELEAGLGRLRRVAFGAAGGARVRLPTDGAIAALAVQGRQAGVVFPLESWTRSRLWYRYDPAEGEVRDTRLVPPAAADVSSLQSREVEVPSHDGVMVPLSLVYRKGLPRDGSHPTLLEGYGSYGYAFDPFFSPMLLAWLERGGVYAVAHVRGGGEYGEEWHRAGKLATKANTWKDFIACAEYLVAQGYTAPAHLAGTGASAGGILIGRAITERPELFRAAVPRVGVMNALRTEHEPGGPANIPEFGTTATKEGFEALREMDAVSHVQPRVRYPAVLLTSGIYDSRVEAWQAAKMAAALQERSVSGLPVLLRVDFDAGHGMGLTKTQRVRESADVFAFLLWQLGGSARRSVP